MTDFMCFRPLLIGAIAALCLGLSACTRSGETGLSPGDLAPDFDLATLDGGRVKLSDFRGKAVLLNFWASWCGPCAEEMPALERLYDNLRARGFTVLAVGVEDPAEELRKFSQKFGLGFPVLIDADGKVRERYKIEGFPETVLIDPEGKIVLFNDPGDNRLRVKIVGPREWDDPSAVRRIEALLPAAAS
jgi:peroxiredoxin